MFWRRPLCNKHSYFMAKIGQFWWSRNTLKIELYVFVSHSVKKKVDPCVNFREEFCTCGSAIFKHYEKSP